MKFLITGANGFIGSHLVQYLLQQNHSITAIVHRNSNFISSLKGDVKIVCGDLLDSAFVNMQAVKSDPDIIYHLAAQSLPQVAWQDPAHTFKTNLFSSLILFEAARQQGARPLIVTVSSSSVYAPGNKGQLLSETDSVLPGSIYAASKLAMENLAGNFIESIGLKIIIARPFFIIGPRKKGDVSSDFARGIARIERGEKDDLSVGNLNNIRDFLDVHDAVSALWKIAIQGKPGSIYNICSGYGHTVGDLLAVFKKNARREFTIVNDPDKARRIDDPFKTGDPAKLSALGWKPQIGLDNSVISILDYWRAQNTN
jgi:nucleoside-diphosphate-sugar epimerase